MFVFGAIALAVGIVLSKWRRQRVAASKVLSSQASTVNRTNPLIQAIAHRSHDGVSVDMQDNAMVVPMAAAKGRVSPTSAVASGTVADGPVEAV